MEASAEQQQTTGAPSTSPLRCWAVTATADSLDIHFESSRSSTPSDGTAPGGMGYGSESALESSAVAAGPSYTLRPTLALVPSEGAGQDASTVTGLVAHAKGAMAGKDLAAQLHNARFRPATVVLPLATASRAPAPAENTPETVSNAGVAVAVTVTIADPGAPPGTQAMTLAAAVPITALFVAAPADAETLAGKDHTFAFSNASASSSNGNVALHKDRPCLPDGSVPRITLVVTLRAMPMDNAAACGLRGVRAAQKAFVTALPYGAMPLGDLYRELCFFAAVQTEFAQFLKEFSEGKAARGQATYVLWPKSVRGTERKKRLNSAVAAILDTGKGIHASSLRVLSDGPGRTQPRWALLKSLDLSNAIVGDVNLPPVLGVAAHCKFLESFTADRNGLSLVSAPAIVNTFGQHPNIRRVSLCCNDFFESAGDELLRTIRVNRRIVEFEVAGNAISDVLLRRYQSQLERNRADEAANIFNPEGAVYSGVAGSASPDELPAGAWDLTLAIWRLLIAAPSAPASDESAPPRPPTAAGGPNTTNHNGEALADTDMVPVCVSSPLFVAAATRAFRTVAASIEDPVLRQLVAPVVGLESAAAAGSSEQQHRAFLDAQRVAVNLAEAQAMDDLAGRSSGPSKPPTPTGDALVSDDTPPPRSAPADVIAIGEYHYPLSFAKLYVVALGTMASFPHRWPYAARALKCLGRAHEQLGVPRAVYAQYNEALFKALMHELGPDTMHARMQGAWLHTSSFILRALLIGRADSLERGGAGIVSS